MLVRDGRILLGRRSPRKRICAGLWDVIGGHVEAQDTYEDALRRELREEIGVRPTSFRVLGQHQLPGGRAWATNEVLYNLSRERGIPTMAYSTIEQGRLRSAGALEEVAKKRGARLPDRPRLGDAPSRRDCDPEGFRHRARSRKPQSRRHRARRVSLRCSRPLTRRPSARSRWR